MRSFVAVLIQEWSMLHNSEISTLEVKLVRQARISSLVLKLLCALALAKVLTMLP
jgi:hypothetical protein